MAADVRAQRRIDHAEEAHRLRAELLRHETQRARLHRIGVGQQVEREHRQEHDAGQLAEAREHAAEEPEGRPAQLVEDGGRLVRRDTAMFFCYVVFLD